MPGQISCTLDTVSISCTLDTVSISCTLDTVSISCTLDTLCPAWVAMVYAQSENGFESRCNRKPLINAIMQISVYINGFSPVTREVVSSINLEVSTSTNVDVKTAILLAGNRVERFLNAARSAKSSGARLSYKMTMPHFVEIEIDGEKLIDTRDASVIFDNTCDLFDKCGAFTFKAITASKARVNIAGAFNVLAEYAEELV